MNGKGLFLGVGVVITAAVVAFALKGDARGDEALPEEAPTPEVAADAELEAVPQLTNESANDGGLMVEQDEVAQAIHAAGDFPPIGESETIVHDDGTVTVKKHVKVVNMETGEVMWKPTVFRAEPVKTPIKIAHRNKPDVVTTDAPKAGPEVPEADETETETEEDGR